MAWLDSHAVVGVKPGEGWFVAYGSWPATVWHRGFVCHYDAVMWCVAEYAIDPCPWGGAVVRTLPEESQLSLFGEGE